MYFKAIIRNFVYGWLLTSDYLSASSQPDVRIDWGTTYDITKPPTNLTADGIQADVPQCTPKHVVNANTLIIIPDAYPNLKNTVYPQKVRDNALIIMTPEIGLESEPCNEHVNIISKVILGIVNDEARLVFFPTLTCIGTATDQYIIYMLQNLLNYVEQWSQQGKNIVITFSISLYRNNPTMQGLIEQILSYKNVAWDIAAGNSALNYCGINIYSLVGKYANLAVTGRTSVNPKIPNVIATDSNFGPCVFPYGPGDLTYQNNRVFGTSFVKEIGALNAAIWNKNPSLTGQEVLSAALQKISKVVAATFPDKSTGQAIVFAQGATCAPIAITPAPTAKSTQVPSVAPTKTPTTAPTLQNFGTFKYGATGNASQLLPYFADSFCLSIQFSKIGAKNGFAMFRLANQMQKVLNNITVNNPPQLARYFEIIANKNNTQFNVYRGAGNQRQLAQQHAGDGEPIKYLGFDGTNAQYQANECADKFSEYETDLYYYEKKSKRTALKALY